MFDYDYYERGNKVNLGNLTVSSLRLSFTYDSSLKGLYMYIGLALSYFLSFRGVSFLRATLDLTSMLYILLISSL